MSKPFHKLSFDELDRLHNTNFEKWQIAMRIRKNQREAMIKRQEILSKKAAAVARRDRIQAKWKDAYQHRLMSERIIGFIPKYDYSTDHRVGTFSQQMLKHLKSEYKELRNLYYYYHKIKRRNEPYKKQRCIAASNAIKAARVRVNRLKAVVWRYSWPEDRRRLKSGPYKNVWKKYHI